MTLNLPSLTGAPVLMFAGGEDDYDEPDTCQKFIASLAEEARSHVSLKYYPKATHGWDIQERARVFYENSAALGRGRKVRMTPNREVAGGVASVRCRVFRPAPEGALNAWTPEQQK